MRPKNKYAKSDDLFIAYQVFGAGAIDLVFVPGSNSHLGLVWDEPGFIRFKERLGSFCRVILFDKHGTGLSDRSGSPPTLEVRMDDVLAVMDAESSKQAAYLGFPKAVRCASSLRQPSPSARRLSSSMGRMPWGPGPRIIRGC